MDYTLQYLHFLGGERYEMHRYFLPARAMPRIKFLRKWFRVIDRDPIPPRQKRRKNDVEFAETAVMTLARIDALLGNDIHFVAGSGWLSPQPWGVFGEAPEQTQAEVVFPDFPAIANFYESLIFSQGSVTEYLSFRIHPRLPAVLARKYDLTPHFVVSLAICLLYDILLNCGPDSPEFYDLFTNDTKVGPTQVNIEEWEDVRCRAMGFAGRISERRWPVQLGQVRVPHVPLSTRLEFQERPAVDDLTVGEKVKQCYLVRPSPDVCLGGPCDENVVSPETDIAILERLKNSKMGHLI